MIPLDPARERVSALTLEDRQRLLPGLSARRIVHDVGAWFCSELVATDAAIERLRAWIDSGGLDRPAPEIRERVTYYGDPELFSAIVGALEMMAPPARDLVLSTAVILGTGWSSNGWIGSNKLRPLARLIVLSGSRRDEAAIRKTMLHEAAHAWLEPVAPKLPQERGSFADLEALAGGDGWLDDFERHRTESLRTRTERLPNERQAEALAVVWNSERNRR